MFGFDPVAYAIGFVPVWFWWVLGVLAIFFVIGFIWRVKDILAIVHKWTGWPGVLAIVTLVAITVTAIFYPKSKPLPEVRAKKPRKKRIYNQEKAVWEDDKRD